MARVMTSLPTDDTVFAAFLAASRPRVLSFLQRLCGRDAEDVLQEALTRAWRSRDRLDPASNPEAWLLQTAFRAFLDHRRARQRTPTADQDGVLAAIEPRACPAEARDELQAALRHLAPLERALLLGFHAQGCSLQELARRHGLPLNTVKSHLHRARTRLHEHRHDHA